MGGYKYITIGAEIGNKTVCSAYKRSMYYLFSQLQRQTMHEHCYQPSLHQWHKIVYYNSEN